MDLDDDNIRTCPHCSAACAEEHQYCPACGFPIGTMGSVTDDKFVGRTLPGGHHILDLISVGGMGRVYRAEQSVLGRTVAVKIIHPHLLSDENSAARFLTEARAASQLNHPNSVSVFDFGKTDDGQPYLVMEFLRGKDLARVTYEEGPLSFVRIVDVLRQTLGALGEAHDLGIVHRDLKPENIILEPMRRGGDFVKVVDFGLAKLKADVESTSVTSPGIVCGTPDYMAPEQGRGDEIDGRADLYAVGVILFQLLTGRLPFEAESPTQVVMMHLSIPVPDPRQIAPERGIPDSLVDVTMTALEKDFTRRYQDAHEFAEALGEALTRLDVAAPEAASAALPGGVIECPSCGQTVPQAKFCGECAAPLPRRSAVPAQPPRVEFPLPLTARDDALSWLVDRRHAVLDSFVGARVVGDPGMGKTRLIEEFVSRQRNRGDFVVCTGPDPFWAQVAYHAIQVAVRELARLSELDIEEARFEGANPDARRGLVEIFAGKPAAGDQRTPQERRHGLAQALIWALGQAALFAEPHGVIVVIDDLDRIDTASRWAFADALAAPQNFGVLFLAAHTPGFESGWGAEQTAARVLAGLSSPVAATLVPARPVGLLRFDEGRPTAPMYVEQVLRYSLDGGSDPPSRLADLIALRVDTLEPAARRALQALAVLGDSTARDTLAQLVPKDDDLETTIRELSQSGLVIESDETVSTAHPLLREIVLGGIPVGVRRELHAKALGVGEKSSFPIEASAQHAYFAQESFQALLLLEQVADRARVRGDVPTEVLALRRALEIARLEIARGQLDDPLRAVLIFSRKLGASLTRAGDFADAEGVLQEALDIAGPSGPDRARVLSALAQVARGRNRGPEALGYIDQAIAAARQSNAHDLVDSLSDTRRAWAS